MLMKKSESPVETASSSDAQELALWRDKYERLLLQFNTLQKTNQDLEEKLLTLVEKSEQDKLLLSHEIDHLAERLASSTNTSDYLRHECARYKSDCMLAVHLLQCQPASYANNKLTALPEDIQRKIMPLLESCEPQTSKPYERKPVTIPTQMTFPPTAVFLHNISLEEEAPPEPVSPDSRMKIPELFVKNILNQPDYQTPKLMQCPRCGVSVARLDKSTQTSMLDFASLIDLDESTDQSAGIYRARVHSKNRRTLSGDSHTSTETPV